MDFMVILLQSEKFDWMGPKRHDYSGAKVFFKHRSYEAEVSYLENESEKKNTTCEKSHLSTKLQALWSPKSDKLICRLNCEICNKKPSHVSTEGHNTSAYSHSEEIRW